LFFILFYRFILSFSGIWGFLFSNSSSTFCVLGCAIYVTDADPAMSSEALEASHERKQLARALEQAEERASVEKWKSKG
jgi:hypothetical protein